MIPINKKEKQFKYFERKNNITLPDWYKRYILARSDFDGMDDRPFEFIYYCLKMKPELTNRINDYYRYCLNDPEYSFKVIQDITGNLLKRFK